MHAKMISQTCSRSRAEVEKRKYSKKKKKEINPYVQKKDKCTVGKEKEEEK